MSSRPDADDGYARRSSRFSPLLATGLLSFLPLGGCGLRGGEDVGHPAFKRRGRAGLLDFLQGTHTTWFGVPPDTRREPSRIAQEVIRQAEHPGKRGNPLTRTLPTQTECFTRHERRRRILELSPKPKNLPEGPVVQRAWRRYQSYLSRIRPVARADFYRRLKETRGLKSIRALAKVTGEDWSRVARVLKLLELPTPVLEYLRHHDVPWISERRLQELFSLKDARLIWERFQQLLSEDP